MITIRTPRSQVEYITACAIVQTIYQTHGYVEALKSNPSTLFIALENDNSIIGSVGIFTDSDSVLPTEVYYGLSINNLFPGLDRSKVFEIGRLATLGDSGTLALAGFILAICKMAEARGYQRAIACLKPRLLAILERRLGIILYPTNSRIIEHAIEKEYRGYFLSDPKPEAVYMSRDDMDYYISSLEKRLNGKVEISITEFDNIVFERLPMLTA